MPPRLPKNPLRRVRARSRRSMGRCASCGRPVRNAEGGTRLHGLVFHDRCAHYRSRR